MIPLVWVVVATLTPRLARELSVGAPKSVRQRLDNANPAEFAAIDANLAALHEAGATLAELRSMVAQPAALTWLKRAELPKLLAALEADASIDEPARLLVHNPPLLKLDASKIGRAVAFLASKVGGAERVAAFVEQQPQALLWRAETTVAELLRERQLPERAIRAVARFPAVGGLETSQRIEGLFDYFEECVGLSHTDLGTLVAGYPQVLGLCVEANVAPTVDYLASLGADVKRLCKQQPQLLGLSLDANIRPTVEYLERLGVDVRRVVRVHPAALGLSVRDKIEPLVAYLAKEGMREVPRVLSRQPAVLSLSIESNLRPKLCYLRSIGMDDVGRQLDANPGLLTISLDANIRPTVEVLTAAGLVASDRPPLRPRHLCASLKRRIEPRLQMCTQKRIAPTLSDLTLSSDANYCTKVGCTLAELHALRDRLATEQQGGGLLLSWLEGVDLLEMLGADDGGESLLHAARDTRDEAEAMGETPAVRPPRRRPSQDDFEFPD